MIEMLLIGWMAYRILAGLTALSEGIGTASALARGKPVPARRVEDGPARTVLRAMARSYADDLIERRTAGAAVRTAKRTARAARKAERWEARAARRNPRPIDLDVPDWVKDPAVRTVKPGGPDRTSQPEQRTGPEPKTGPEAPAPDRPAEPPAEDRAPDQTEPSPPTSPAVTPPDHPSTNPRPGRPRLVVVPPSADIPIGEDMTVTTTTPTGEVVDPAHLAAFFEGIAKSPSALLPVIEAAIANLGRVGFSDLGVTGPIHQIQQALVVIRDQAALGRTAAGRHVQHAAQTAATPGAAIDNRWYGARSGGPAPAGFTPAMPGTTSPTPATHTPEPVPTA